MDLTRRQMDIHWLGKKKSALENLEFWTIQCEVFLKIMFTPHPEKNMSWLSTYSMFFAHPTRHILTFKACRRAIKFNDHLEQARDGIRWRKGIGGQWETHIWIPCFFVVVFFFWKFSPISEMILKDSCKLVVETWNENNQDKEFWWKGHNYLFCSCSPTKDNRSWDELIPSMPFKVTSLFPQASGHLTLDRHRWNGS